MNETPAGTPAPSFAALIKARLRALIDARSYSLTGLARAMGRSHTWILRKLDPATREPRPLELGDVDAILSFLGEPPAVILAPVYRPGDRELLALLGSGPVKLAEAEATIRGAEGIAQRLQDQGLVNLIGGEIHPAA